MPLLLTSGVLCLASRQHVSDRMWKDDYAKEKEENFMTLKLFYISEWRHWLENFVKIIRMKISYAVHITSNDN